MLILVQKDINESNSNNSGNEKSSNGFEERDFAENKNNNKI